MKITTIALILLFCLSACTPKPESQIPSAAPETPSASPSPSPSLQPPTVTPAPTPATVYVPTESDLRSADEMTLQPMYTGSADSFPASAELPEGTVSVLYNDGYAEDVPADTVELLRDVVYDTRDNEELTLQILLPKEKEEGALLPLVVYIPGSAWMRQNTSMAIPTMTRIAARGYAVAIVEYRGTDIASFPAQAEDAKTAIRFLRKTADEYGIDTERVALWGDSSGGHTAVLAGITGDGVLDNGTYDEFSCVVNCIVDWYGPTDVSLMGYYPSMMNHTSPYSPEGLLLGGIDLTVNPEKAAAANPMSYITEQSELPPMLIMHGSKDTLVPFNQSVRLFEALKAHGQPAEMVKLENAGHGFGGFAGDEALERVLSHLKLYL